MNFFLKALVIAGLVAFAGCSDDGGDENPTVDMGVGEQDSGDTTEMDMGTPEEDMSANNSSMPDMDFGPCAPDEYLVTTDDSCAACPGTEFTCDLLLPNIAVDTATNIVTLTFDPAESEIVTAEWAGNRSEGDGMSEVTIPIRVDGEVDGGTITFDLSNESEGDELQLGTLRLTDGCEETVGFSFLVRWEPGGAVVTEPTCP